MTGALPHSASPTAGVRLITLRANELWTMSHDGLHQELSAERDACFNAEIIKVGDI